MNLKRQAETGVKWTSASITFKIIVNTLQIVILARFLSPEDFGLMAMVLLVIGFAERYTDMGISAAIIYRQDVTKEQLSSLYWLNILSGIIVFGLFWFFMSFVVNFFKEPRLFPLLHVLSFTLCRYCKIYTRCIMYYFFHDLDYFTDSIFIKSSLLRYLFLKTCFNHNSKVNAKHNSL